MKGGGSVSRYVPSALDKEVTNGGLVSCGAISQSSLKPEETYGIKNMPLVTGRRLTIRGFIVTDPDLSLIHI